MLETHPSPETISVRIPSRLELLSVLDKVAQLVCERLAFDEAACSQVTMSVIEAGTNAIQHGNVFATDKIVRFEFKIFPEEICVWVADYGKGFDASKVANPTDDSALLDPHGRGLYLMRAMVDDVAFETRPDHGTTVCLKKRCTCRG
jgi:serine/threonine-protein kinase RsbW